MRAAAITGRTATPAWLPGVAGAYPPAGKKASNTCPAVDCDFSGSSAEVTSHWIETHHERITLQLCPLGNCRFRARSGKALQNHLMRRHRLTEEKAQALGQLPPLMELVLNQRYKDPGQVGPLTPAEYLPADALPFASKSDLQAQVEGVLSGRKEEAGKWLRFLSQPSEQPPPSPMDPGRHEEVPVETRPDDCGEPATVCGLPASLLLLPPPPPPPLVEPPAAEENVPSAEEPNHVAVKDIPLPSTSGATAKHEARTRSASSLSPVPEVTLDLERPTADPSGGRLSSKSLRGQLRSIDVAVE